MRHSKRTKLSVDDVNAALRVKNVDPLYGYTCGEAPKFRKTTVNANDIYFDDDEEVDFDSVLNKPLPKIPLDVTFTAHWLAIEGVQPAIPQNPTPSGKIIRCHAKIHYINKIASRCQGRTFIETCKKSCFFQRHYNRSSQCQTTCQACTIQRITNVF